MISRADLCVPNWSSRSRAACILCAVMLLPEGVTEAESTSDAAYMPKIESHFRNLASTGVDTYGPRQSAMWMAVIDTRTGKHPDFDYTPKRVYRQIGAPRGSSLYWDQPMIVAAHAVTRATGKPEYAEAADRYLADFLATCVDEEGLFLWGNHSYYDAFEDRIIKFSGGHHELRPITPAWELFWRQNPKVVDRYIRTMTRRHLYDPESGGFNRHDDGRRGHAFIESGGVLAESLAWLHSKTKDPELLDTALRIARYSFRHRGESTGLVINEPDFGRWDSKVCTTEVAVWAQSLLRAAEYTGEAEFAEMARQAVAAYLEFGYDATAGRYYGQLSVKDGTPVVPTAPGYWPRQYAEIWNPDQWPTHDYPLAMAEVCITLHQQTGERIFREGIRRWAEIVRTTPLPEGQGAYADQYGRCIHFLMRAGRELDEERLLSRARALADEAVERLWENGWFQGHPGTHLYESVAGVGYLVLALVALDTGEPVPDFGCNF